jgi:lysyl-tRNA synthetase class II
MMKKVCITLLEEQVEHLQQMSHKLSLERNENLTLSRLIREALEQVYPIKKAKKTS